MLSKNYFNRCILAALLLQAACATAQQNPPTTPLNQPATPTQSDTPVQPAVKPVGNLPPLPQSQDPTRVSDHFNKTFRDLTRGSGQSQINKGTPIKLPAITLVALAMSGGRPATALIEIDKTRYMVKKGEDLTFIGTSGEVVTLHVDQISKAAVRITLNPYDETIVLH